MIVRLTIIALLWLGSIISYDLNYLEFYGKAIDYLHLHQQQVISYVIVVSLGLLLGIFFLALIRAFAFICLLARFFFEVSQFAICLLSFAAVVFWFDFGQNLWADLGFLLAAAPFLVFAVSCLGFWIYDFNYPLRNRISRNLTVPALSLIIIFIARIVG